MNSLYFERVLMVGWTGLGDVLWFGRGYDTKFEGGNSIGCFKNEA